MSAVLFFTEVASGAQGSGVATASFPLMTSQMDCSLSPLPSDEYASHSQNPSPALEGASGLSLDSSDSGTVSLSGTQNAGVSCEQCDRLSRSRRNSRSCPYFDRHVCRLAVRVRSEERRVGKECR